MSRSHLQTVSLSVWFGLFRQEQKACRLLKTKNKTKNRVSKDFIIFFKSLSTYLRDCVMKRTSIAHLAW